MLPRTAETTEWETLFYLRVAVSCGVGTAPFYVDTPVKKDEAVRYEDCL